MKSILLLAAAALLLGACATEPMPDTQAQQRSNCRNVDPRTGSRLVRKQDCAAAAQADREAAQDSARQLQELQQQTMPTMR